MAPRDGGEAATGPRPLTSPAGGGVQLDPRGGHSCFHLEPNKACVGAGPVDAWAKGGVVGVRLWDGVPRLHQEAHFLPHTKTLWVMAVAPGPAQSWVCARVCAVCRCVREGLADSRGA